MQKNLIKYSREQLAASKGEWPDIARTCEVSYSWLCKFAKGEIPEVSYTKVVRLANHLQKRHKPNSINKH